MEAHVNTCAGNRVQETRSRSSVEGGTAPFRPAASRCMIPTVPALKTVSDSAGRGHRPCRIEAPTIPCPSPVGKERSKLAAARFAACIIGAIARCPGWGCRASRHRKGDSDADQLWRTPSHAGWWFKIRVRIPDGRRNRRARTATDLFAKPAHTHSGASGMGTHCGKRGRCLLPSGTCQDAAGKIRAAHLREWCLGDRTRAPYADNPRADQYRLRHGHH